MKEATRTLQRKYQNENKLKSEEKKRGFNCAQTIDPEYLSMMTQKMKEVGAENNHDSRIVPTLEKTL